MADVKPGKLKISKGLLEVHDAACVRLSLSCYRCCIQRHVFAFTVQNVPCVISAHLKPLAIDQYTGRKEKVFHAGAQVYFSTASSPVGTLWNLE